VGISDRCPAATHRGGTLCQAQMVTTALPPAPVATLFAASPSHRSWRDSSPSAPFPSRQQDQSPYRRRPVSHSANRGILLSVNAIKPVASSPPIRALPSAVVLVQRSARARRGGARWSPPPGPTVASHCSWRSEDSVVPAWCTPFATAGALVGEIALGPPNKALQRTRLLPGSP